MKAGTSLLTLWMLYCTIRWSGSALGHRLARKRTKTPPAPDTATSPVAEGGS